VQAEQQTQDEQRGRLHQQQRSLYRRHRPRTFAEVVGQEPVVRTLSNAVTRGKVHHAYLFVGSRGTGKTSMAKILAACVNCERGPTVEPCGECESCVSIARASSLDVIEMDAASNNSVDDIRELRESVAFAPVSGRRKVYILDEAHMLSTAAWNAFLKTLEEPPPNTVFVLATTEAGKVPATVVDRCHRFDFHRPTVEQIASVIRRVAAAESIEIPPEAVAALARAATGSFRDALGTLEQLVTYSGQQIALEDVLAVLGVADARLLEETVDALATGDARRALLALEQCSEQGRDAASFASDLEARARELMVVQTLEGVPDELALTPEADAALEAQAQRVDRATVVRLLELLAQAMEAVRAGADARTRLELALVKAARPEVDGSTRALLARIERLERAAGRSPGVPDAPHVPEAARAHDGANDDDFDEGPPQAAGTGRAMGDEAIVATEQARSEPAAQPADDERGEDERSSDAHEPAPRADQPAPRADQTAPDADQTAPDADQTAPDADRPAPRAAPAAGEDRAAGEDPSARGADLAMLCALWPAVVELVTGENGMLGACIAEARPVAVDGEEVTLAFASTAQFHKKKAEDPANRAAVSEGLASLAGGRWRLSYELRDEPQAGEQAQRPDGSDSEQEWVARFMREFDAEEVEGAEGVDLTRAKDVRQQDDGDAAAVTSDEKGA
jgi:DNA polymerase III subunit gamma/tau